MKNAFVWVVPSRFLQHSVRNGRLHCLLAWAIAKEKKLYDVHKAMKGANTLVRDSYFLPGTIPKGPVGWRCYNFLNRIIVLTFEKVPACLRQQAIADASTTRDNDDGFYQSRNDYLGNPIFKKVLFLLFMEYNISNIPHFPLLIYSFCGVLCCRTGWGSLVDPVHITTVSNVNIRCCELCAHLKRST